MIEGKLPVVLVKWYDYANWLLDRVDSFPKNQRFIFGQRMADLVLGILEMLVEATYTREKAGLLRDANRKMEVLRWLVRMAKDRQLVTARQYEFSSEKLAECGKMVGGWQKQTVGRSAANEARG